MQLSIASYFASRGVPACAPFAAILTLLGKFLFCTGWVGETCWSGDLSRIMRPVIHRPIPHVVHSGRSSLHSGDEVVPRACGQPDWARATDMPLSTGQAEELSLCGAQLTSSAFHVQRRTGAICLRLSGIGRLVCQWRAVERTDPDTARGAPGTLARGGCAPREPGGTCPCPTRPTTPRSRPEAMALVPLFHEPLTTLNGCRSEQWLAV